MKVIRFYKESDNRWYADIPDWTGEKWELEMVLGADTMLDILAQGEGEVSLIISTQPFEGADDLVFESMGDGGAWYSVDMLKGISYPDFEIWLCHVTEFVFGEFPKILYIK